ncbi:hypothetical protein KAU33_16095 [Candidatus Dependentiae bacterium]|nr:hypothetical protein [Candidatus Dependentiae bacterium]
MSEFDIIRILDGDIILSKENFEKFVNEMNLPIFKDEFKTNKYKHELFFTIFNGVTIRKLVKVSKLNVVEM